MLTALFLSSVLCTHAAVHFNITELLIPEVVPAGQTEVEIECRYDAEFTLLSWFKGPNEFLRYRPGTIPSIQSFAVLGVGRIDVVACGSTVCRLKLASLTEEASGLYRCDLERETPPHLFATRPAYMNVLGTNHRRPLLEGILEEYGEGDQIEAYCRGAPGSELRWYVNGGEMEEMRSSPNMLISSSILLFLGIPPTVTVQCAEFREGLLLGSKEVKAKWKKLRNVKDDDEPQEQRNGCQKSVGGVIALACVTAGLLYQNCFVN